MASLLGFAARYHCATSTDFSSTEQPCDCMLMVRHDRDRRPCVWPITSEARHGSIWSGVLVAAISAPMRDGSPPHCSMQRRVASTAKRVVELLRPGLLPSRKSG